MKTKIATARNGQGNCGVRTKCLVIPSRLLQTRIQFLLRERAMDGETIFGICSRMPRAYSRYTTTTTCRLPESVYHFIRTRPLAIWIIVNVTKRYHIRYVTRPFARETQPTPTTTIDNIHGGSIRIVQIKCVYRLRNIMFVEQ